MTTPNSLLPTPPPLVGRGFCLLILVLAMGLATGPPIRLSAAEPETAPRTAGVNQETITTEWVTARKQEAEQATDLDAELKQKVLQVYDQAQLLLDGAAKSAARAAALQNQIDTAPAEKARVERELNELLQSKPADPPSGESLEKLKTTRIEKEAALAAAKEESAAVEAEIARRVAGGQGLPKLAADARARLARVEEQLRTPFAAETPESLSRAQTASLLAEVESLEQAIAAYETELRAQAATGDLLPLQQRLAAGRVSRLEEEVKTWREAESRALELETKRKANEARLAAMEADPELEELAGKNQTLAELAETVATKTREEILAQEEIRAELDNVQKQYQRAKRHVDLVGLTNSIGQLLRTQRTRLPDLEEHYREVDERQAEVRRAQMALFELEDSRTDARSLDRQVAEAMKAVETVPAGVLPEELEATIRDSLIKQNEYRDSAIANYYDYLRTLGDSEVLQRQLLQESEAFANYIDERVLWIRSAGVVGSSELRLAGGILSIGACSEGWRGWSNAASAWLNDARRNAPAYAIVAVLLIAWLVSRGRIRRSLAELGEDAATSAQVRIWPTLQALLATAAVAAASPALLFFLGIRLTSSPNTAGFIRAVGDGMVDAALWWLPLALLTQLCRPKGLAELHFGWPAGGLRALRRHLRWYALAATPLVFLVTFIEAQGIERWQESLGRIAFLALMLTSAVFAHLVLRESGDTVRYFRASKSTEWLFRSRHILYWSAMIVSAAMALAATLGYYYTAYHLADRVRETVLLVTALAVASALISRWVLVVRRRLAIERMRQRRAADSSESATDEMPAVASVPTTPIEQEIDLAKVTEQTRRFVNSLLCVVGILLVWWIWIEVLPALAFLDRVPVWQVTTTVVERIAGEGDATILREIERPGFISLADVGLTLLVLFVTVIASKNLPGLLEIVLPQRLPLDAGARYAISTLTRYGVIAIGFVVGFKSLGFSWSQVQWLVAALTVGLGFGLQEIFANFISGLILLFERPIRVGDVVTIDNVTGVVSRIQTRATTVTNWDRQDFIVPNKEFITGRLLNWTRSDRVNRIVINVGIAYGSDTEKARRLIEQALREHAEVLEDPKPMVTFEEFGESSLNIVARCYLAKLENRLQTIHDLHTAIDRAFREARIEIAFPQRDIHIRSGENLPTKEHPGDPNGSP